MIPLVQSLDTCLACAAEDYTPLNRFPRMVQEFYVDRLGELSRQRNQRLARLKTKPDAEQYVRDVKDRIRKSFGAEPQRTPLNPRVTGIIRRDGYDIEKVIFDSRPGFPVTANLYLPTGKDKPVPGVVGTCGHSPTGKAAEAYQSFAQGLARLGFACLIYDPIGQGERLQYLRENLKSSVGTGTREHLHAGNQQYLVGEFFGMWRAWDGTRALDYLMTRPEVDSKRIGVTGNSGGGTMTTWLCGVEHRWSMAAPSCFVSTFRRNLENELPQDTEQCPPRSIALGLDHGDFLAAMAPKPVIILAKERDYFDVRGSEETYDQLRRLYGLLGVEENIALFVGPTGHGYSQENRDAMYSWFHHASGQSIQSHSGEFDGELRSDAKIPFVQEPSITIESDETLWCTKRGQVATLSDTRTVFDFTRDASKALAASRPSLRGDSLKKAVTNVLKLPDWKMGIPEYRNWRYLGSREYKWKSAIAYTVSTEPGIHAIVYRMTEEKWHSRPPRAGKRAILYVSHLSSDDELRHEPIIREISDDEPSTPIFTCDARGVGESLPATGSNVAVHSAYGNDYFYAAHGLMLDRPYLGQKTFDVLRVLQWLSSLGHQDVHLVGKGWGALIATFASVLSDVVTQVTLKHALTSYSEIAESEHYDWPLSTLLPSVLARFDLPDCYAELKSKRIRQIEPWGAEHPEPSI